MVSLRNFAGQLKFSSEAALENFVWVHLSDLFHLTPLERQFVCQGEVCDILAIDAHRQLHILELKNSEDRYLIQQLTRYYANIQEMKPFADQIDYGCSIRLIGIAPIYHRHNLIDQQYNTLQFDLWQFHLSEQDEQVWFHLQAIASGAQHVLPVPYEPIVELSPSTVPAPPEVLLTWLGGCTVAEQAGILKLRAKLLTEGDRLQETIEGNWIRYGRGKSKPCGEIYFERKRQRPVLFLWLPTPSSQVTSLTLSSRKIIGRLRVWLDGTTISHVGHVAEGLGRMKLLSEWEQIPREKRPSSFHMGLSLHSRTPVEIELLAPPRSSAQTRLLGSACRHGIGSVAQAILNYQAGATERDPS